MGLAWQRGPFGVHPAGHFLLPDPLPRRVLYIEPLSRRMRVELAGAVVAESDAVMLLHETDRYPTAYFPAADVDAGLLRPGIGRTDHVLLGEVSWWSLQIDGRRFEDVAWSHASPPPHAAEMRDLIAFVWDAMDAFYEEDEPILGHAAEPYHRVDIRASRRHVTVRLDGVIVADTRAPLAVFETGFEPRWYLPASDVRAEALREARHRTFCPYKGTARHFDVVAGRCSRPAAAWSYPEALPESARLAGYVSFDPGRVDVSVDERAILPAAHQEVIVTGTDRALSVEGSPPPAAI